MAQESQGWKHLHESILMINQHLFPLKSMMRFTENGRCPYLIGRADLRLQSRTIACFARAGLGTQRAERGDTQRIEDEFQTVVAPLGSRERREAISSDKRPPSIGCMPSGTCVLATGTLRRRKFS